MSIRYKDSIPDELSFWDIEVFKSDIQGTTEENVRKCNSNNLNFKMSSDVPSIKIYSYDHLRFLLYTEHFDGMGRNWIFRGQRDHSWRLQSTLERIDSKSLDLREIHLERFKKECRRILKDNSYLLNSEDDNELWAIGQHYGLDTPLLDWTYSPYVALFFAFNCKAENEDGYRVIYALNKENIMKMLSSSDNNEQLFFEPKADLFGRLVNQSGMFTIAPYCTTLEDLLIDNLRKNGITKTNDIANYICKIYIKTTKKCRNACLKELRQMNIHIGTLCPDLAGATKHCNQMIREDFGIEYD